MKHWLRKYFVHIVAVDENNAIGFENNLLFRIKKDLEQFKRLTLHTNIISGTKTLKTLPPLKNRKIYQLSRNKQTEHAHENVIEVLTDIKQEPIDDSQVAKAKPVFIIGGGEVYRETLKDVSVILLTRIHAKAEQADTYYPDILNERKPTYCTESTRHVDEETGVEYSFVIYGYDREDLKHFLRFKTERENAERQTAKGTMVRNN